MGGASGKGHDRSPYRAGYANGHRWSPLAFRDAVIAEEAARPHQPQLHRAATAHACGTYAWDFEKGKRKVNVRVEGQLVFNSSTQMINAALSGLGLAFVPEGAVTRHLGSGHLRRVLEDWCPLSSGYHLYYPSRRQSSPAFAILVDALRYPA